MDNPKVILLFCRTLYSQSAGSVTMGSIASYLESNGFETELFLYDRESTRIVEKFLKLFSRNGHEIIIAKINYQDHHIILPLLEELVQRKWVKKIAVCGPLASHNYRAILLNYSFIDAVLCGYPEISALEFVQSVVAVKDGSIVGYTFAIRDKSDTDIVVNPSSNHYLSSLDEIPYPKRTIELSESITHINLEASRGCLFNCSFCHLSKNPVIYRSSDSIVKEIIYLHKVLGKTLFIFNDSCFWTGAHDNERIVEICNGIIKESLHIYLCIYLRIRPIIPHHIIQKLVLAGLVRVFVGVENSVHRINQDFNKTLNRDDFFNFRRLHEDEFKINVHIGFITFEPFSTIFEVESNIDYLMQIRKMFRISILIEPLRLVPKSPIFEKLRKEGLLEDEFSYKNITYGYKFKYKETSSFLNGIQQMFRLHLNKEAYKYEYYSTSIGLIQSLICRRYNSMPDILQTKIEDILDIRDQGMHLIYNFLKCNITKYKEDSNYTMSLNDQNSNEFIKNFKILSTKIEITYGFIISELNYIGSIDVVKSVYTGMEGIDVS